MLKVISPFIDADGILKVNDEVVDDLYSDDVVAEYIKCSLVVEVIEAEYNTKIITPKKNKK